MEKEPRASHITPHGAAGDTTSTSPASGGAIVDEADKKLEAMGYTPVRMLPYSIQRL